VSATIVVSEPISFPKYTPIYQYKGLKLTNKVYCLL